MARRKYNTANERALLVSHDRKSGNDYYKVALKEDEVYNMGLTDEQIKSKSVRLKVQKVERGLLVYAAE